MKGSRWSHGELLLVTLALALAGCGAGASPPSECEPATASLPVATIDGAPTIARLELSGPCFVGAGCRPASSDVVASDDAPCAKVTVIVNAGTECRLELVSGDGLMVTERAVIKQADDAGFPCTSQGQTVTAHAWVLEPSALTVDFSKGAP
jgi:hypothetical protein